MTEGLDLAGEHLVEAKIVRHTREVRCIPERNSRQGATILAEAAGPLLGEVHGVAHAAAVAARENPSTTLENRFNEIHRRLHDLQILRVQDKLIQDGLRFLEGGMDG